MFEEHTVVVLRKDLGEHRLRAGDIGTVVARYDGGYEVEFTTADGDTIAVVTLAESDLRPVSSREILHVRELQRSAASP